MQRKVVWKNKESSKLVESILLSFPIPPIYVFEDENENWETIDGQQRLTAIFRYYLGDHRIPTDLGDGQVEDLVELYESEKLYKFIHIPVQSGSDEILKLMNRPYSVFQFEKVVNKFREKITDVTISTDIIVGFPGEEDEDFQETVDLLKRVKPNVTNISKYTPRPRTKANLMKQTNSMILKERSKIVTDLCRNFSYSSNLKFVGKNLWGVFTETRDGKSIGRLENYRRVIVNHPNLEGSFLVHVEEATHRGLIGAPVSNTPKQIASAKVS